VEGLTVDAERAAMRVPAGYAGRAAAILSASLAAYALYWVLFIVQPQVYRVSFLLLALVLTFLLFPASAKATPGKPAEQRTARVPAIDWLLIGLAIVALGWPLLDFARFVYRAAEPSLADVVLGVVTIVLVLEATRRSVGPILPITAIVFLLYGWLGPFFDEIGLGIIAHRGYGIDRLVGTLYMTL